MFVPFIQKHLLAISIFFISLVGATYYYFLHPHQFHLTHVSVNPFYEASEDIKFEIDLLNNKANLEKVYGKAVASKINRLHLKTTATKNSIRRPLRIELLFYYATDTEEDFHNLLIFKTQNYLDSLNELPHIYYEERHILKGAIATADSLIVSTKDEQVKQELVFLRNHKQQELNNNFKINYRFSSQAQIANLFNPYLLTAILIFPFLFLLVYYNF